MATHRIFNHLQELSISSDLHVQVSIPHDKPCTNWSISIRTQVEENSIPPMIPYVKIIANSPSSRDRYWHVLIYSIPSELELRASKSQTHDPITKKTKQNQSTENWELRIDMDQHDVVRIWLFIDGFHEELMRYKFNPKWRRSTGRYFPQRITKPTKQGSSIMIYVVHGKSRIHCWLEHPIHKHVTRSQTKHNKTKSTEYSEKPKETWINMRW